jgi:nucleoid-associated protein YgaU
MHAHLEAATPRDPHGPAPWAAAARLAPVHPTCAAGPAWPLITRRPAAAAAAVLLAGGIVAASVGAAPARAAGAAPVAPAAAPAAAAPARNALASLRVAPAAPGAADTALLARLLAAPTAADEALLAELLATPAAPAALPAHELALAAAVAPAAPASVSFSTVTRLPSIAASYSPAAVALPAVTVADQERAYALNIPAPPAPPVAVEAQQTQPPAPPGYVQPPGYQDGVPFGGQIGAVPGSRPASRPARPAAPARPALPAVYTVRAGDTLSSIALRFYGDARYAPLIWEYNYRVIGANPNVIIPGQRLALPGVVVRPVAPAPLPARGPIPQRSLYTIQPRDFLRWMSQRAYGNEMLWPEIYHANRNVLGPNPDLIYPGVTVYIP